MIVSSATLALSQEYVMLNSTHLDNLRLVAGAAAGACAGVLLIPIAAPIALGVFGFGAAGPIAGEPLAGEPH